MSNGSASPDKKRRDLRFAPIGLCASPKDPFGEAPAIGRAGISLWLRIRQEAADFVVALRFKDALCLAARV
jgi:hypothetical protein